MATDSRSLPTDTALTETHPASAYANALLRELGAPPALQARAEPHPALRWAQSGAMALTGAEDGDPQVCPVPLASCADGLIAALSALSGSRALRGLDGARLLGERAALAGYRRRGLTAPGGSCRLLPAADGALAVNLPRESDWQLLPAWLEAGVVSDWPGIARVLAGRGVREWVARGRLLGLAVAPLAGEPVAAPWCETHCRGAQQAHEPPATPLVIDLSSLWAGPLCAQLLRLMGARVIKVESSARPDGLRLAGTPFYHLLNAGKASVALDFSEPRGRAELRELLLCADIVIEASRPRALRQLGICAESILGERPGLTWIAISGYGRAEPQGNWVAFGDDAGVAGGLSQLLAASTGRALFCADAVADPLTALHAALAAWSSYQSGGGRLLSLALAAVVAHAVRSAALTDLAARERAAAWGRRIAPATVAAPWARPVRESARPLGADTAAVLATFKRGARIALQREVSAARRPASRPKNVASASDSPEL